MASDAFNIMCLTVKIPQDKNVNRLLKNSKQKNYVECVFNASLKTETQSTIVVNHYLF